MGIRKITTIEDAMTLSEEELDAEIKRRIMGLNAEQCAELLKIVKEIQQMSEEEVNAELERIRAERARKEVIA